MAIVFKLSQICKPLYTTFPQICLRNNFEVFLKQVLVLKMLFLLHKFSYAYFSLAALLKLAIMLYGIFRNVSYFLYNSHTFFFADFVLEKAGHIKVYNLSS